MKRYTTATCFSAFALPHVLFIDDFEKRKSSVMTCCLAWNISLLRRNDQREQLIDTVWKMFETTAPRGQPSELEDDFAQALRTIIASKRDFFPWQRTKISMVELFQKNGRDVLVVETDGGVEEIEFITQRDPSNLSNIIEELRRIHHDTAAQIKLMHHVKQTGGLFSDIDTTQMALAYGVQRADLISYYQTLIEWRETQTTSHIKDEIHHWLNVLVEIEENSKTVLAILTKDDSI